MISFYFYILLSIRQHDVISTNNSDKKTIGHVRHYTIRVDRSFSRKLLTFGSEKNDVDDNDQLIKTQRTWGII